jgi:hypothetical protein
MRKALIKKPMLWYSKFHPDKLGCGIEQIYYRTDSLESTRSVEHYTTEQVT